jgi:alcohol dehydrogenase class IV
VADHFSFAGPGEIIFGPGAIVEIGALAARYGRKALVTHGRRGQNAERLSVLLGAAGIVVVLFTVSSEPDVAMAVGAAQTARETGCTMVIGIGGGSAIDAGKAAAALAANPGDPLAYLEVVGRGSPLQNAPLPFLAIPTTAGAGSEATRNAVLSVPEKQVKVSLRSTAMLARVALVDPELTISLPPEVTAATGMDALTQLIEPYVSTRATPMTDLFCREGIARAARALPRAFAQGRDLGARVDMAYASLLGGLALANGGLGAAHGLAGPIGGTFDAPHGAVCAALLPGVVRINARALQDRAPDHPALYRYREAAVIATGQPGAEVMAFVHWLEELRQRLGIPGLEAYGIQTQDLADLAEKGAAASSMKANPLPLTTAELIEILETALRS